MTARRSKFLLGLALVAALTACSGKAPDRNGEEPVRQEKVRPTHKFTESYEYFDGDCSTAPHEFGAASPDEAKAQLCIALQDDALNQSCAEPLRRDLFDNKCHGQKWSPVYAPVTPPKPESVTQIKENRVREALSSVLIESYRVHSSLEGERKVAAQKLAADMMSCGINTFGPKCLDYVTIGSEGIGSLSVDKQTYIYYSEFKIKGFSTTMAFMFRVERAQVPVMSSGVEVYQILNPRRATSIADYLNDPSNATKLITAQLTQDFVTSAWQRLSQPHDIREMYHLSSDLFDKAMGDDFTRTRSELARLFEINSSVISHSSNSQYQEELLTFMLNKLEFEPGVFAKICEGLLRSSSSSVRQAAAAIVLNSNPTRLELKPTVIRALNHSHSKVRAIATEALSKLAKSSTSEE